jgi:hypothetical protein
MKPCLLATRLKAGDKRISCRAGSASHRAQKVSTARNGCTGSRARMRMPPGHNSSRRSPRRRAQALGRPNPPGGTAGVGSRSCLPDRGNPRALGQARAFDGDPRRHGAHPHCALPHPPPRVLEETKPEAVLVRPLAGSQEYWLRRKQRSGCGIRIVTWPSTLVRRVIPSGEPLGFWG